MVKTDVLRGMVARANEKYVEAEVDKKVSQKDMEIALAAFSEMVMDVMKEFPDEKISLGTLGSFKAKEVPAKDGEMNGKPWHTDAHTEVVFKVSKAAKRL